MKRLLLTVVMCIVVSGAFVLPKTSHAEGGGWLTAELAGELDEDPDPYSSYGQCFPQEIHIAANNGPGFYAAQGCLFTAKSYSYTVHDGILYATHGDGDILYPLTNTGFGSYTQVTPSPETNDFIFGSIIIKDYPDTVPFVENGKTSYYDLQNDTIYNFLTNEQGSAQQDVMAGAVSRNGKWRVLYVSRVGIVRFNVEDKTALRVTDELDLAGSLAVSNDGRYVAAAPNAVDRPTIYDTENCGEKATILQSAWSGTTPANVCPSREVTAEFDSVLGSTLSRASSPTFSADDKQLTLYGYKNNKTATVTLHASGYAVEPTRLEYLALGDSFSSGEGDMAPTEKGESNYLFGTDIAGDKSKNIPKEMCHISERSYPFRLAAGMELGDIAFDGTQKWGSVACSGALIDDISSESSQQYEGQSDNDKPRLQGYDAKALKSEALNEMVPGRQRQIEFVKKYQPKVVTLTVGGNDVQFASIITACVKPILKGGEWTTTCSYAKDYEKKSYLSYTILQQYDRLVKLYDTIKKAGAPSMKLYVLGYPVFVNDTVAPTNAVVDNIRACGMNVRLNYDERRMAAESTRLMNQVIRAAADEVGAIYIDTETALQGHRLCDDTSLPAVNGITGAVDNEESFHPNSYGHALLANRVWDATNSNTLGEYVCRDSVYVTCPGGDRTQIQIPDYFKGALNSNIKALADEMISDGVAKVGTLLLVSSPAGQIMFMQNSVLQILLYSNPVNLGTANTDNEGHFAAEVLLPKTISPGYHTLELHGTGVDGKPLTVWKIIEVRSDHDDDYDGDGIPNAQDMCTYLEPAGYDLDSDGIDDGCDSVTIADYSTVTLKQSTQKIDAIQDGSSKDRVSSALLSSENNDISLNKDIVNNSVARSSAPSTVGYEGARSKASSQKSKQAASWIAPIIATALVLISAILLVKLRTRNNQ